MVVKPLLALFLSFCFAAGVGARDLHAQAKASSPTEQEALKDARELDKRIARFEKAARSSGAAPPLSFRNFVRGALASGNLILVPYVNNLNISAGYWGGSVTPNYISWPKGSGVAYGHTMSFIVAGEVLSEQGDTLRIISESYNRSGGDQHPTGSHKYFFTPLPGYYNMNGDPATRNRLNNNADDRRRLRDTGYYYVGGLSEDVNGNGELDIREDVNGNEVLDLELVNRIEYSAQSNLKSTWPAFWPPQSYVGDDRPPCAYEAGTACNPVPGLRAGRWNGAYGSFVRGDQESYYLTDDRDNDDFPYYPFLDPATGLPDRRGFDAGGRRGLGVTVKARQYQWASVLAEDIFISTFDVENVSRFDIPTAVIAMIVDYDIAGRTSNNEAFFDTVDDITYQWYKVDLVVNGFKVGYGGVGFLESPGLPRDGRDNDGDGLVDESRANGIDDDGDWRGWVDVDNDGVYDNEDVNNNFLLDAGEDINGDGRLTIEPVNDDTGSDGVGPEQEDYPGPDPDGTEVNGRPDPGEPNFEFTDNDEIDQIGLTGMVIRTPTDFDRDIDDDPLFWEEYIQPDLFITPSETADIIYVYASGVSSIDRGQEQRFSIAFFCGNDFQDMLRNKRTMQNIYDSDYDFAKPPRTPFLSAVTGDTRVTLVWDQSAESSRDPIYGLDFEMYKIYRSTDPEFNDIKTITDAFGNPLLWEPLQTPTGDKVQFDIDNGLSGAHPVPIGDFGISYDMGTDSGLEYSYVDSTVENGRTYYYCVVSVDRGYHDTFFNLGLASQENLAEITPTESSKIIEVDAFDRPVNVDRNCAVVVPQRPALGYVEAHVVDGVQRISGNASGVLRVDFLIPEEANSKAYDYEFTFSDDGSFAEVDSSFLSNGLTTGFVLRNITTGDTLAVSKPGDRGAELFNSDVLRAQTYDGMRFTIDAAVVPEPANTRWLENNNAIDRWVIPNSTVTAAVGDLNLAVPLDYEIRVSDAGADTSNSLTPSSRIPTNFTIWDVTDLNAPRQVPFQLTELGAQVPADTVRGTLSPGDAVNVRVSAVKLGGYTFYVQSTWLFSVSLSEDAQAFMTRAASDATALYDSLALRQVRGMHRRPLGPTLGITELDDFFEQIRPWYTGLLDSLMTIPGWRDFLPSLFGPEEYLQAFEQMARNEIPVSGDVFLLETSKPFDRDDVLRFKVDGNRMEENITEEALEEIYVVPDPYIAVSSLEGRNRQLPGRGERRIDFRNLPPECIIRIFTISGRQVKIIRHVADVDKSTATWNLQSDDGLDVSYGVYLFHVEAPGIGEKIGRFSIIR